MMQENVNFLFSSTDQLTSPGKQKVNDPNDVKKASTHTTTFHECGQMVVLHLHAHGTACVFAQPVQTNKLHTAHN